jgi:guanylate kinase
MSDSEKHKIIILAAPSGAGKTTIKSRLLAAMPSKLSFSISAATRKIRAGEQHGVDYFFIDVRPGSSGCSFPCFCISLQERELRQ